MKKGHSWPQLHFMKKTKKECDLCEKLDDLVGVLVHHGEALLVNRSTAQQDKVYFKGTVSRD